MSIAFWINFPLHFKNIPTIIKNKKSNFYTTCN